MSKSQKGLHSHKKHSRLFREKEALLRQLVKQQGFDSQGLVEPITRRKSDLPAPPSFSQERLWFLDQLEPGKTPYQLVDNQLSPIPVLDISRVGHDG